MPLLSRRRAPGAPPFNLSTQDRWSERAERAVALWERHAPAGRPLVVSDLGAGNARVARLITRPQTTYIAYDLAPQHDSINRWDVRDGMPHPQVDAVFLLGLIEYVEPSNPLISRLAQFTSQTVVSYVGLDEETIPASKRRELAWMRHETREQTQLRFQEAGFSLTAQDEADEGQTTIWLWERAYGCAAPPAIA